MDWYLILTPLLLLPVVVLFYFIGCSLIARFDPAEQQQPEPYEAIVDIHDRDVDDPNAAFALVGPVSTAVNDGTVVGEWVYFGSDDETDHRHQGTTGWIYFGRYLESGDQLRAIWRFDGVPPGDYQVEVSYSEARGRATNCHYEVYIDEDAQGDGFDVDQSSETERARPFVWSEPFNIDLASSADVRVELVLLSNLDEFQHASADAARLTTRPGEAE